jgi:hypothetical protein
LQSGGLGLRHVLWDAWYYRFDVIGGYRFFKLDEGLFINDTVFPTGGIFVPGTFIDTIDVFETENQFHGGEVGMMAEFRRSGFSLELRAKVGLGNNRQRVEIFGETTVNDTISSVVTPGGLLALPTNIGTFSRDEFTVIPQLGLKLGYHFTDNLRATVGYDILHVNNVIRPGDQIDLSINPTQLNGQPLNPNPGGFRPAVTFRETDLWLQGFNAGIEFRH